MSEPTRLDRLGLLFELHYFVPWEPQARGAVCLTIEAPRADPENPVTGPHRKALCGREGWGLDAYPANVFRSPLCSACTYLAIPSPNLR